MPYKLDKDLVQEAVEGSIESFTQLCQRYYPAMVAIANSILGDVHLAEDAAQETFANAVQKLPQLRRKSKFGKWLASICRNTARKLARKKGTTRSFEELPAVPAQKKEQQETETVKRAIAGLPASAREAIFLRYYDGMTYEKISAVLDISEQAINGRLRRARKKIKLYLSRNGFGEV